MKNKFSVALLFLISLVHTNTVFSGGSIGNFRITEVWSGAFQDNGFFGTRLRISQSHANPDSCASSVVIALVSGTNSSGVSASNQIQQLKYEQMFTVALAANINSNNVSAYLSGCTKDGKYARVLRLTSK